LIVCLHGLGRSPADWDAVRPRLERLGEVRTPRLPRDPGAALDAAAAATAPGATVVGHSMGGLIALRLAHERRVEFAAIVLTGCFFPPARNGRSTAAAVRDYLGHRVAYLRGLRGDPGAASAGSRAGGAAALGSLLRLGIRRGEFDAAAAAVRAPVLVVHARDDHHVPVDFALAAAARHPSWDLRLLDSGGHHAHRDRPDPWLAVVLPWLESQPSR
jgi:pimeloyl-ACP methyl ester carboxylesterase